MKVKTKFGNIAQLKVVCLVSVQGPGFNLKCQKGRENIMLKLIQTVKMGERAEKKEYMSFSWIVSS